MLQFVGMLHAALLCLGSTLRAANKTGRDAWILDQVHNLKILISSCLRAACGTPLTWQQFGSCVTSKVNLHPQCKDVYAIILTSTSGKYNPSGEPGKILNATPGNLQ